MNISSVGNYTFPSIGQAISISQSGRLSVPVSQSSYIYSHFKHISGVPAQKGESGVNIDKLKIIDTLIEQISRMKKQPEPAIDMKETDGDKNINSLIEQYQNQVRKIHSESANTLYPQAAPLTGMIFSIAA